MRVTIVASENRVNVEGFAESVDCSSLDEEINVVQWYGTFGEIEFVNELQTGNRKPNQRIDDFAPYQKFVALWEAKANAS